MQPPWHFLQLRCSSLCMTLLNLNRALYSLWRWFNSALKENLPPTTFPPSISFLPFSSLHLQRAEQGEMEEENQFPIKLVIKPSPRRWLPSNVWGSFKFVFSFSLNVNQEKKSLADKILIDLLLCRIDILSYLKFSNLLCNVFELSGKKTPLIFLDFKLEFSSWKKG